MHSCIVLQLLKADDQKLLKKFWKSMSMLKGRRGIAEGTVAEQTALLGAVYLWPGLGTQPVPCPALQRTQGLPCKGGGAVQNEPKKEKLNLSPGENHW